MHASRAQFLTCCLGYHSSTANALCTCLDVCCFPVMHSCCDVWVQWLNAVSFHIFFRSEDATVSQRYASCLAQSLFDLVSVSLGPPSFSLRVTTLFYIVIASVSLVYCNSVESCEVLTQNSSLAFWGLLQAEMHIVMVRLRFCDLWTGGLGLSRSTRRELS